MGVKSVGRRCGFQCPARPSDSLFLQPGDGGVECSATSPTPCQSVCQHAFHQNQNGRKSGNVGKPQLNGLFYKSCYEHGISSQQQKIN